MLWWTQWVAMLWINIYPGHRELLLNLASAPTPRQAAPQDQQHQVRQECLEIVWCVWSGCDNGQACYWYQQGCSIGCPTCDSVSGRVQVDICGLGKKATNNNPETRTVNRDAEAGSVYDIYKHNPWRAPGSAPVLGQYNWWHLFINKFLKSYQIMVTL